MELFDGPPHHLQVAMREQWEQDKAKIAKRGIIPDWMGEPRPLDKSLARVLNWTYVNGSFEWTATASAGNRKMTAEFGFNSPVNAHEAVERCKKFGLLDQYIKNGRGYYNLTQAGEYALEEWELEAEINGLDVCELMKGKEIPADDEIGGLFSP